MVKEVLPLLRPRDREILAMRYDELLTDEAVGKRLGIKRGAAKKAAHDARARLRVLLEERGVGIDNQERR